MILKENAFNFCWVSLKPAGIEAIVNKNYRKKTIFLIRMINLDYINLDESYENCANKKREVSLLIIIKNISTYISHK